MSSGISSFFSSFFPVIHNDSEEAPEKETEAPEAEAEAEPAAAPAAEEEEEEPEDVSCLTRVSNNIH